MPPAAKRRKVATGAARATAATAQRGIQAFGRISKFQVVESGKCVLEKEAANNASDSRRSLAGPEDKKRKRDSVQALPRGQKHDIVFTDQLSLVEEEHNQSQSDAEHVSCQLPRSSAVTNAARSQEPSIRQGVPETPTKGARSRLDAFAITSSSPLQNGSSPLSTEYATPCSSLESDGKSGVKTNEIKELPDELRDLINFHSSFLTALSLHYAHNGPMTPADLRNLTPGVERVWKKRRVTTDAVRRILSLQQRRCGEEGANVDSLSLSDYGHGKICVEAPDNLQKTQRLPINEETLHSRFSMNLEEQWTVYRSENRLNATASAFISTLPLQQIVPCASLSKLAPLHSKGQLRLSDLKAGAITAQKRPLAATCANTSPPLKPSPKETMHRSSSLLTRIRTKQLHQSTLPLPPSPSVLARKSALQRLPDIAPVLSILVISSLKHCNDDVSASSVEKGAVTRHVSFTMPTLVQHLQMSLRNPISKEEAVRCVGLLAECWPEWVGVRNVGKLVGVTVRGKGIGSGEVARRVHGLLDGGS